MKTKKEKQAKVRQGQRVRIAKAIKDVRATGQHGQNITDAIISLKQIASNYPKK